MLERRQPMHIMLVKLVSFTVYHLFIKPFHAILDTKKLHPFQVQVRLQPRSLCTFISYALWSRRDSYFRKSLNHSANRFLYIQSM